MLDLIFFAIVAIFIIVRLLKILGRVDEDDIKLQQFKHMQQQYKEKQQDYSRESADIEIISVTEAALSASTRDVFDQIRKVEFNFNADLFIIGVKKAFTMIIEAFAKEDKETIKYLLVSDVYESFVKEIDNRLASGQKLQTTVVGVKEVEILNATIVDDFVTINVKISSEQINITKDNFGNILDGNVSRILNAQDIWSFTRNIKQSKVWKLAATAYSL